LNKNNDPFKNAAALQIAANIDILNKTVRRIVQPVGTSIARPL
jgi:hypothetical protein